MIAIIGGFIKSLMVIFRFLSKPFTKIALYSSLLNELFTFDETNEDGDSNYTTPSNPKIKTDA